MDGRLKRKNLPWGGMDIFWNCTIFHQFASHSKVVHSEDHFSEGLFRSPFSKSSFKFKRKWKVRVRSRASVSKYYSDICGSSCYK